MTEKIKVSKVTKIKLQAHLNFPFKLSIITLLRPKSIFLFLDTSKILVYVLGPQYGGQLHVFFLKLKFYRNLSGV